MSAERGKFSSASMFTTGKLKKQEKTESPGKQPKPSPVLAVIMAVVLPVLFILALLISSYPLRIGYFAVSMLCVLIMWASNSFVPSARRTMTVLYLVLALLVALAMFIDQQTDFTRQPGILKNDSILSQQPAVQTTGEMPVLSETAPAPTETPEPVKSEAQQRLEEFFTLWNNNDIPGMLEYCSPSWMAQQAQPANQLWQIMGQRTPGAMTVEDVQGSDANTSRTMTVRVEIHKVGKTETELVRMQVLMFRVNNLWYVDPQSLNGTTIDVAAEEAARLATAIPGSTIAPTATPLSGIDAELLYYNADGGKYYHTNPRCDAVVPEYWPLDSFYRVDLNSATFKNLIPCKKCNAPARD